ncbi:MAG: hypothetical protein ACOVLK_02535 [Terrimicrobiaceae bacterium]|jgi:hypothetical protein
MTNKQKFLEEIRSSRAAIARDASAIGEELNVVTKVRRSILARPLAWLGSAAALGYILSGPKTRTPKKTPPLKSGARVEKPEPVRAGRAGFFSMLLALVKVLLPIVRPALSAYAAQRLGEVAARVGR